MGLTPEQIAAGDAAFNAAEAAILGTETPAVVDEAATTPEPAQAATDETPVEVKPQADEKPASSSGDIVQTIIDQKYKGDKQAFVKGLYEGWNSTAKLAREVEDLKTRLAQGTTPTATLDTDKEYQWLSQRLPAIDSQLNNNIGRQNSIITELDSLRESSARLSGRIEATEDDSARGKLEREKDRADQKISELRREFFSIKDTNFNLDKEKFSVERFLDQKKTLFDQQTSRQEQKGPDSKWEAAELTDFETTAFDVAVTGGLMPDSEDFSEFLDTVRAKVVYEHQKHADEPALTADENRKLVSDIASKELKRYQKANFQSFSQQKVEASGTRLAVPQSAKSTATQPKPGAPNAPQLPKGKPTAEQARAHAARILG